MPEDFTYKATTPKTAQLTDLSDIIYAPARPASLKPRHRILVLSFLVCVFLPAALTGLYLWTRAMDQFTSHVGFIIQQGEATTSGDLMIGIGGLPNAPSSDSTILFAFLRSQEMVERVNDKINLRAVFARHSATDPIFALRQDSSLEGLVRYWRKSVTIAHHQRTGLLELQVRAFDPKEAQMIAKIIVEESAASITRLSETARRETLHQARADLDASQTQMEAARLALTGFRSEQQFIDPNADITLRMGLLASLEHQLAEALTSNDLLTETTQTPDPRLAQSERRIAVIRGRIQQERQRFGDGHDLQREPNFAALMAEFDRLSVILGFAEERYLAALSALDLAKAKAQRQSRYLATFQQPTLAESAEHPRRGLIFGLTTLFLLFSWAILALIFYSLRDRR